MSLWQARLRPSASLIALLCGVSLQLKSKTPPRCTMWSSDGTVLTPRLSAKEATGVSMIAGSPSQGSSRQHPKIRRSGL